MVKWNEVLRIERELGANARFLGANLFNNLK
jgi:enolase